MNIKRILVGFWMGLNSILLVGVSTILFKDIYIVLNGVAVLAGTAIAGSIYLITEDIEKRKITEKEELLLYVFGIFTCICTMILLISMFSAISILG